MSGPVESGYEVRQFRDCGVDIAFLAGEQFDARLALGNRDSPLLLMFFIRVVKVDHLANVGQAEADPLAAEDPGEAGAVAAGLDARQTLALGCDQSFILIEAERARGDAELLGQVGYRVALPFLVIGQLNARNAAALVHGALARRALR